MKTVRFTLIIMLLTTLLASCGNVEKNYWETSEAWFQKENEGVDDYIDAFYLVSTNIMQSFDSEGKESYRAVLTDDEIKVLSVEIDYVQKTIFPDSVNFYSPYYHQFTMNTLNLPQPEFDSIANEVKNEVIEAFDYYMKNWNNGRRFVLIGFSQGAMMTKELLKHLDDEQYSRLVAAYIIGFGINDGDLECEHIVPARSADDIGVAISFNTVRSSDGIWPIVYDSTVTCINPVNWVTDATPADIVFGEQSVTAMLDTTLNVLVVEDFVKPAAAFKEVWPEDCLHFFDIQFYNNSLRENVLTRAYESKSLSSK